MEDTNNNSNNNSNSNPKLTQEEQDLLDNIIKNDTPTSPKISMTITSSSLLKESASLKDSNFDLSAVLNLDSTCCIITSPIAVSPTIVNKLISNSKDNISAAPATSSSSSLSATSTSSTNTTTLTSALSNNDNDQEVINILLNKQSSSSSSSSSSSFRPVTPTKPDQQQQQQQQQQQTLQQFSYEKTPVLSSRTFTTLNKQSNSPIPFPNLGSLINDPSSSSNSKNNLILTPPSTPTPKLSLQNDGNNTTTTSTTGTLPPSTPTSLSNNNNEDNINELTKATTSSPSSSTSTTKNTSKAWSFKKYLYDEIHGGYLSNEANDTMKREQVYNFVHVPWELEKLISFGFLVCFDSFLFLFTFLPIRFILSFFKLLVSPFSKKTKLTTNQIFDLFRGFIWIVCFIFLNFIDSSMLYHYIRGQAVIKLYVIYNVLEVLDKLCCSFGQDIFDSLYWMSFSINSNKGKQDSSSSTIPKPQKLETRILGPFTHLLVATGYVLLHSLVLFCQVITLNVAINSYNSALLTLMMSNQFVELKGSVFKRFEKENLFQISCSDIVERFQAFIFLTIIIFQNLSDLNWDLSWDFTVNMLIVVGTVLGSELLVDAIKHAFITKFNKFSPQMYSKFFIILSDTIVDPRNRNFTESSWGINSIIGFVPFPLASIVIRVFHKFIQFDCIFGIFVIIQIYICLVLLKIFIKIIILGQCLTKSNITTSSDSVTTTNNPISNVLNNDKKNN